MGWNIQVVDTPEAYRPMAEQLVPPVLGLLKSLSDLETEIFRRSQGLDAQKQAQGIPSHQVAPGWKDLMTEYHNRIYDLASPLCTEKLLSKGYGRSYGSSPCYGYLDGDCQIFFTMKSAKRAVIETKYHESIDKAHQFVLRPEGDGWKLDAVSYRYSDDKTWHAFHI